MDFIFRLLKSIDNMGIEFKFKIEGKTFTTILGSILTLITWAGLIICIWYFGHDIIKKKNPSVLVKRDILDDFPFYDINQTFS